MLDSILTAETAGTLSLGSFLLCMAAALILGAGLALVYRLCGQTTQSFTVTLALLPAIVCVIIMMVSGSLGAGVAVAGTFSLVRFRSAAGTAREIGAVFTAMAAGLACGMGYPVFALLFAVILSAVYYLYARIGFGENKQGATDRMLRISVPEDLEYAGMFDDLMEEYTERSKLVQVKTTNLGSINRLSYEVTLKNADTEKAFLDALRCRNGNLEISLTARTEAPSEL